MQTLAVLALALQEIDHKEIGFARLAAENPGSAAVRCKRHARDRNVQFERRCLARGGIDQRQFLVGLTRNGDDLRRGRSRRGHRNWRLRGYRRWEIRHAGGYGG